MRPAHKLLKRLLRNRAWEIDWRETATGKLRADLLLLRPGCGAADMPLHTTSTNPLIWLAWIEGRLDTVEVTPYVYPGACDALGLPPEERCYFMRHCRDAMARLCGRRAEDKATLAALGALPHHARLSRQRAVRTPQDARCRAGRVAGSPRPDLPPATGTQWTQGRAQTPMRRRLVDFEPTIQSEQFRAFLRSEPFARLQPQGHLLN
jgi:hypothetical protein